MQIQLPNGVYALRAGALSLQLAPAQGGALLGFWHGDTPIFRDARPALAQALAGGRPHDGSQSACYPLIPFSGRVAYRRFNWEGRDYELPAQPQEPRHALHGIAWQQAWQVLEHDDQHIVLQLEHLADASWPFSFTALHHISLTETDLTMQLRVSAVKVGAETDMQALGSSTQAMNPALASAKQPMGLGWHPYFVKRAQSRIRMQVSGVWISDENQLPHHTEALDAIDGLVADMHYDNGFTGWNGLAEINDEVFDLRLQSDLRHSVVYTPEGKPYFCVEPVSHRNNALGTEQAVDNGIYALAADDSLSASMQIQVQRKPV